MHQKFDDDEFARLLEQIGDSIEDMGADGAEYRKILREGERILNALKGLRERRKELEEQEEMMLGYVFAYRISALRLIKEQD